MSSFAARFAVLLIINRAYGSWTALQDDQICQTDDDCAPSGRCLPVDVSNTTIRNCLCTHSCPPLTPVHCRGHRQCSGHVCDKASGKCICPSSSSETCLRRNVQIIYLDVTRDTPYVGDFITLRCCVNIDPGSVRMRWYHNESKEMRSAKEPDEYNRCWILNITSVRYKDSGMYTCRVWVEKQEGQEKRVIVSREKSLPIQVRAPITVRLIAYALNSTAFFISWKVNPPTLGVNLRVEGKEEERLIYEEKKIYDTTNVTVASGLFPGKYYTIFIETMPFKDNRTASDKKNLQTAEAPPGPPELDILDVRQTIGKTCCEITWRPPLKPNGRILYYEVSMIGVIRRRPHEDVQVDEHRALSNSCADLNRVVPHSIMICAFDDFLPNRNYSASVTAVNSAGSSSPATFKKFCVTNFGLPSSINAPQATAGPTNDTIVVRYGSLPDETNGPITCYYLALVPYMYNISEGSLKSPQHMDVDTYERAMEINLQPDFQPKYAYIALSFSKLPEETIVGDNHKPNDSCSVLFSGRYASNNSPLKPGHKYAGFLIVRVDSDPTIYPSRRKRNTLSQPSYGYSDYFAPIIPGGEGLIQTREISGLNADFEADGRPPKPQEQSIVVLSAVLSVLLIVLLITGVLVLLYAYKKGWLKHFLCFETNFVPNRHVYESPRIQQRDFHPIPVDDLPATYLSKHRDSDFMFTVEFESLPHFNFDSSASDKPENSHKNRYNDIKAFDVTRVKLLNMSETGEQISDYINASVIQGYKGRKLFIAAQGPTQETVNDFWRMIWEQRVQIIVMVTNLQEKYRTMCVKYWPEQSSMLYGNLEVVPLDCVFCADYIVRKFELQKANLNNTTSASDDIRPVVQYHYTGWNDYRAPEGTIGLLRFIKQLRRLEAYNDSPVVVHCSAGVGRTGTYVAIDGIIDQIAEERRADIFGFVSNLRRQRNFMVQSLEQYVFVYKALAEWYVFGDTDIEADRIHDHVKSLREQNVAIENNRHSQEDTVALESGMKREYDRLAMSLEDTRASEFANRPVNASRNRYSSYIPYDRNRIILMPVVGDVDLSYINATIVKGYFYRYILTQDPLADTVWDFWRMVIEQGVICIVMLSDEKELEIGEKYWPSEPERSIIIGERPAVSITLTSEEQCQHFLLRRLNVSSTKDKATREVVQFMYKDWTPAGATCLDSNCSTVDCVSTPSTCWQHSSFVPAHTASFLDLIGKVLQRQSGRADPGPVVLHCRNGSERSGLYCAVSILLERLRTEGRIDVFQTVKALQAQRVHVISSLPQYEFCYQSVLNYMESFR